jgi:hypothetical protein
MPAPQPVPLRRPIQAQPNDAHGGEFAKRDRGKLTSKGLLLKVNSLAGHSEEKTKGVEQSVRHGTGAVSIRPSFDPNQTAAITRRSAPKQWLQEKERLVASRRIGEKPFVNSQACGSRRSHGNRHHTPAPARSQSYFWKTLRQSGFANKALTKPRKRIKRKSRIKIRTAAPRSEFRKIASSSIIASGGSLLSVGGSATSAASVSLGGSMPFRSQRAVSC